MSFLGSSVLVLPISFQDFAASPDRAKRWIGLRQDSGDPFLFAPKAKEVYKALGIDHKTKTVIFSDALDVEKVLRLKAQCDQEGFTCASFVCSRRRYISLLH
jgi:nicotinate phosphoribosyltransferase